MGATSLHSYQLHAPHLTHHSLLLPPLPCTTAALLSHHATRLIVRILRSCETRKDKHEKKSKRHRFHSKKGGDTGHAALDAMEGKVVLIVNVASMCGFTGQYTELEALQQKYGPDNFTVIAFPCNQFGKQEPWEHEQIEKFAQDNHNVSFPIYEKVNVNGPATDPLFQMLKTELPGMLGSTSVKWNFT